MKGIVHPFTKALYEQDGGGNILVTHLDKTGTFTIKGFFDLTKEKPIRAYLKRLSELGLSRD